MPRKKKTTTKAAARPPTRRLTFNITVEGDLAEHKIRDILNEYHMILDEIRSEDADRQILSIWAVIHDCQDVVAEYHYIQNLERPDLDVRDVRVADEEYLVSLGYKVLVA